LPELADYRTLGLAEMILRIVLAGGFGLALGLERYWKNKPMDFRAFMVVAIVSCVMAIAAQEIGARHAADSGAVRVDFMQMVAGVLTGIGFLGAGAIVRGRGSNRVLGTATGASIWASGGMGLTLGFGLYALAIVCFLAIFGALFVFGLFLPAIGNERDDEHDSRDGGGSGRR